MTENRDLFFDEMKSTFTRCVSELPEIKGAALVGGYGRGEGAIFYEDDRWNLYNDIDILLVIEERDFSLIEGKLPELKNELTSLAGVSSIDFDLKLVGNLKKLKPSVYNYDLKYGACIIKGEECFKEIPRFKPETIQNKEIYTLFITRLYCLVSTSITVNNIEDERYINYQLAKACLAICDVVILKRKIYHHSYRERVRRIKGASDFSSSELEYIEWALKFKLDPSVGNFTGGDLVKFHKIVCEMYTRIMLSCLGEYFLFRPRTIGQLPFAILSKPFELAKIMLSFVSRKRKYFYRYLLVMAQAHMVYAYSRGECDSEKVHSYLRRIPGAELDDKKEILQTIFNARMVYY